VAIAVLLGLYADGAILGRHFGEWGALKREIARHAARVSAAAPDARRLLTHQEFLELRARLMTPPATFRSAAFMEPLRIRMMEGGYPYVGVDYGTGRNAVFDPLTMVCTYSD
jgi:hypothetical protein